jgi:hypothetical protein
MMEKEVVSEHNRRFMLIELVDMTRLWQLWHLTGRIDMVISCRKTSGRKVSSNRRRSRSNVAAGRPKTELSINTRAEHLARQTVPRTIDTWLGKPDAMLGAAIPNAQNKPPSTYHVNAGCMRCHRSIDREGSAHLGNWKARASCLLLRLRAGGASGMPPPTGPSTTPSAPRPDERPARQGRRACPVVDSDGAETGMFEPPTSVTPGRSNPTWHFKALDDRPQ